MLANLFNAMLREGRPPDPDFVRSSITPILKAAKPGQPVDASHPDFYRGIAVSNTLCKLLSLILVARVSHWAQLNGILSAEQAGFLWRHAAEEHVFTLSQAIKTRLQDKQSTFVLFVDVKKAYDMVHHGLLWPLLTVMGIPDVIVRYLRAAATPAR